MNKIELLDVAAKIEASPRLNRKQRQDIQTLQVVYGAKFIGVIGESYLFEYHNGTIDVYKWDRRFTVYRRNVSPEQLPTLMLVK